MASFDLISVARPILEDIHQYVENSATAILLVNNAGYILDLMGDAEMIDLLRLAGIEIGVSLAESNVGTTAFIIPSPRDKTLYSGNSDTIHVDHMTSERNLLTIKPPAAITRAALSPKGNTLATLDGSNTIFCACCLKVHVSVMVLYSAYVRQYYRFIFFFH